MNPLWRYVRQRHQHEGAILNPRMRKDQLLGTHSFLRIKRQVDPALYCCAIGTDLLTACDQVEIQGSLSPADIAYPPHLGLDRVQQVKRLARIARHLKFEYGIHEIRSGP